MPCLLLILSFFLSIEKIQTRPLKPPIKDDECKEIPKKLLEQFLGPAFNPHFMSVGVPYEVSPSGNKRTISLEEDFYVEDFFSTEVDPRPVWEFQNHVEVAVKQFSDRGKREVNKIKRDFSFTNEWHCDSTIEWTDLGPDYFPRYLREVKCLGSSCWFGVYKCKPRSFPVKLLRRKSNRCAVYKSDNVGLPEELKELWVWEERAVAFCCDCKYVSLNNS